VLPNSRVLIHQPWMQGIGGSSRTSRSTPGHDADPRSVWTRSWRSTPARARKRSTSTPSATAFWAPPRRCPMGSSTRSWCGKVPKRHAAGTPVSGIIWAWRVDPRRANALAHALPPRPLPSVLTAA
jgi:hypothetical protein